MSGHTGRGSADEAYYYNRLVVVLVAKLYSDMRLLLASIACITGQARVMLVILVDPVDIAVVHLVHLA